MLFFFQINNLLKISGPEAGDQVQASACWSGGDVARYGNLQIKPNINVPSSAAKYEEIYPPEIREFIYISANTYTKDDILKMERLMLSAVEFNLTSPSIYPFVKRALQVCLWTPLLMRHPFDFDFRGFQGAVRPDWFFFKSD